MKKKIIIVVLIVVVLGVAGAALMKRNQSKEEQAAEAEKVGAVQRGDLRVVVASTGSVVSKLDVDISSKASGWVINLYYDISDHVKKGDLLAEIDPTDEQRNVHQAKVRVEISQAKLAQAKETLKKAEQDIENGEREAQSNLRLAQAELIDATAKADRMKTLLEKQRVSQEEYETAQTTATSAEVKLENAKVAVKEIEAEKVALEIKRQDVVLAQANLESDQITLDIAQQRLDETKVYAPISGVVSDRTVETGQIVVSPTNNVSGGTKLFTLSDLSQVFVLASVDESDIGSVAEGQPVDITVDAYPGEEFTGKVVRIATRGENVSNVVTFEVKIEVVSENKAKLKPEMTANVEIVTADKKGVLLIPDEAIVMREGKKFVMIPPAAPGGKPEMRAIKTGIDDGLHSEILDGLTEGEKVLLSNGGASSKWTKSGANNQSQRGPRRPPPM